MQYIHNTPHINLEQYAVAIGRNIDGLGASLRKGKGSYKTVRSTYLTTERGRQVWYALDSLHPEHQAKVRQYFGIEEGSQRAEDQNLIVLPHQQTLSEVTSTYTPELGRQVAMTVAWLLALCPEGVFDKAFRQRFEQHYERYKQDYDAGLLYGQLITNGRSFARRSKRYLTEGWQSLISKKLGQKRNWKVTPKVERALMALAVNCFEYLPSAPKLQKVYESFRMGEGVLVDKETGEVLSGFGYPSLSKECIYDWTQSPRFGLKNKLVLDKHFTSELGFKTKSEPFVWRKDPAFSLSKLTMDDKAMAFNFYTWTTDKDGKKRKKSLRLFVYFIFDVHSGALLGHSIMEETKEKLRILKNTPSRKVDEKGVELLLKAIQNLFKNLQDWGLGGYTPLEMESEKHLAWTLRESLLQPGTVFPYVHFCKGGNPQEKKAENFIRRFRYGVEINYSGFKARPFAKLPQNRLNQDRKLPTYTIEQGHEMVKEMIKEYNRLPHHKYKKKSKWQVFQEGLDTSKLKPLHYGNLARYIGSQARTEKINRNQYVQANGEVYFLPKAGEWFDKIYGKSVEVYTLDFMPEKAWLWQGDTYICELQLKTEGMLESAAQAERDEAGSTKGQLFYKQKESFSKLIKNRLDEVKGFEFQMPEEGSQMPEPTPNPSKPDTSKPGGSIPEEWRLWNKPEEEESEEEYIAKEIDIAEALRKRTRRVNHKY